MSFETAPTFYIYSGVNFARVVILIGPRESLSPPFPK
jgi:hypothetical protein